MSTLATAMTMPRKRRLKWMTARSIVRRVGRRSLPLGGPSELGRKQLLRAADHHGVPRRESIDDEPALFHPLLETDGAVREHPVTGIDVHDRRTLVSKDGGLWDDDAAARFVRNREPP